MNTKKASKFEVGEFVQIKHKQNGIHVKFLGKIGKVVALYENSLSVNIGGDVRDFYYTDLYEPDGRMPPKDKETNYQLDQILTMRQVLVNQMNIDKTRLMVYDEIIQRLSSKPEPPEVKS